MVRLGWQELYSWVLDQVQADSRIVVVEEAATVATVASAEASWMEVVVIAQGFEAQAVILGLGNFLVERQVRLVCHPRSVVPC